jgi:S1-C subfamily serine protease
MLSKIKKKTFLNPLVFKTLLALIMAFFWLSGESHAKNGAEGAEEAALPTPSSTAQRLYSSVKSDLLQLRILLKNGRAQSAVGSGFLIGKSNLVVTNYHVVSQIVMKPETYTGEYIDTNGRKGSMELLAVDVLHDLAVVRINRNGSNVFKVPESPGELKQGQYLYSLGNPLDLGFAISEG